jgi:hypothetical protein
LTELTKTGSICVIFTETLEKSEAWKESLLKVVPTTKQIFKNRIFPFGLDQEKGSHNSYHGKHIFLIDFHVAANSNILQAIKNTCTDSHSSIHIINEL